MGGWVEGWNDGRKGEQRRRLPSQRTAAVPAAPQVYVTDSNIVVDAPDVVKGKRVVLIEDGPTLTHGGMAYGAGKASWGGARGRGAAGSQRGRRRRSMARAAQSWQRSGDAPFAPACPRRSFPRLRSSQTPRCVRASLRAVRRRKVRRRRDCGPPALPGGLHAAHLPQAPPPGKAHPRHGILPAAGGVGWVCVDSIHVSFRCTCCAWAGIVATARLRLLPCRTHSQIADLEASINAVPCDAVVIATPMDLRKVIHVSKPATVVRLAAAAVPPLLPPLPPLPPLLPLSPPLPWLRPPPVAVAAADAGASILVAPTPVPCCFPPPAATHCERARLRPL